MSMTLRNGLEQFAISLVHKGLNGWKIRGQITPVVPLDAFWSEADPSVVGPLRGVQYVHLVMHKCIMVKVGGKNTRKVCKKQVNLPFKKGHHKFGRMKVKFFSEIGGTSETEGRMHHSLRGDGRPWVPFARKPHHAGEAYKMEATVVLSLPSEVRFV